MELLALDIAYATIFRLYSDLSMGINIFFTDTTKSLGII